MDPRARVRGQQDGGRLDGGPLTLPSVAPDHARMRSPSTANQTDVATGRPSRRNVVKLRYADLTNLPST